MSKRELPEPEDDYDKHILGDIERVGWCVLQIEPDDDEEDEENEAQAEPLYSFSLGLFHTHNHPEIILFGLSHEVAGEIINDLGDAIAEGLKIEPGKLYDDFTSVPVSFVKVDPAFYDEYVGYGLWLYGGDEFPMLQCVWPLKSGEFPWDVGYPAGASASQPILDNSFAAPPTEGWPFEDAENTAVMTVQQIARDHEPILLVCHDEEDGMWQFLTGGQITMDDSMLVAMRDIHRIDETIAEIADLPPGWIAERTAVGEPWTRKRIEP